LVFDVSSPDFVCFFFFFFLYKLIIFLCYKQIMRHLPNQRYIQSLTIISSHPNYFISYKTKANKAAPAATMLPPIRTAPLAVKGAVVTAVGDGPLPVPTG